MSTPDSETIRRRIALLARRGEGHWAFALHAAFPLSLTPRLAYLLWANFQTYVSNGAQHRIPWVAVSDLLLSPVCREIQPELYELDPAVRKELLFELEADERFGKKRIEELSRFLLTYVKKELTGEDQHTKHQAQLQRWMALAYVQPNQLARELAERFRTLQAEERMGAIRLATITETFAEPLKDFRPLIGYAKYRTAFARGDRLGIRRTVKEYNLKRNQLVEGIPLFTFDSFDQDAKDAPRAFIISEGTDRFFGRNEHLEELDRYLPPNNLRQESGMSDRKALIKNLLTLPPAQFELILTLLDEKRTFQPGNVTEHSIRVLRFMEWAEAPGGCGLEAIEEELSAIFIPLHPTANRRRGFAMTEREQVLDFLLQLLPGKFEILLTRLDVAREFQPSAFNDQVTRVAAFFQWVENGQGCGLDGLICELEELKWWKRPEKPVEDGVFMMPEGTARFFGREEQLEELDNYFASGDSRRKAAVYGMGGVGKTQFAVRYARTRREKYRHAFFIGADSRLALDNHFAEIARRLNLPVLKRADATQEDILRAVHVWMETHRDWLVIFDNADDLTIVHDYLPPNGQGHILLTTRDSDPDEIAHPVSLDVFTPDEAAQFLLKETLKSDEAAARALAHEMGGLPLALDQAVAFIREMKSSLAEYLTLYRAEGRYLRQRRGRYVAGHESIAMTLGLAFRQLKKDNPTTADILLVCAFCNPDEIPEELFLNSGDALGETIAAVTGSVLAWLKALQPATRFSLLERDPENRMLNLHRVVQDVIRDETTEEEQSQWAERFIAGLQKSFPEVKFENWPVCSRLISQTFSALTTIEHFKIETETSARLLNQAGIFFYEQARYVQAELLYKQALGIKERVLGLEHPETAVSLNNLGMLYESQGRYWEAESLLKRALEIRERVFGVEHPETAVSLNNLAELFRFQGRHAEAEPLGERALGICERVLGPEHSDTARCLNNLALLYKSQGRLAEAEPLYERALGICERTFGAEHPSTAMSLNNLAALYQSQGRYVEAEPLYERALEIKERTLGQDHPSTATSLNNLAELHDSQGRYAEAESLYERALGINEQSLGPEHLDTAQALDSLAKFYQLQGRYVEAEPLLERALGIRERALGGEHPDTARSLNNLALLYASQGRYAEASPLYERALGISERMLGGEHPDTARSLNNLAGLYESQGRYAEAELLYERALAIYERVLGGEHPDTALLLNNLGILYASQGRYAEAELLYERALGIYRRSLGEEHPYTAQLLNNMAKLFESKKQFTVAQSLLEKALSIYQKFLGDSHPDTLSVIQSLNRLREETQNNQQREPNSPKTSLNPT